MDEDNTNWFQKLYRYLAEFGYPAVENMTIEELGNVFSPKNRCDFVCWLLRFLDYDVSEERKTPECLQKIVCNLGFCSCKDALPFLNGTLDLSQQMIIFQRIFEFLQPIVNSDINMQEESSVSLEDVENLIAGSYLPKFVKDAGTKKVPVTNSTTEKTRKDERNIENSSDTITSDYVFDAARIPEDIESDLRQFEEISSRLEKLDPVDRISISTQIFEDLQNCKENIKKINQYNNDLKTINEFNTKANNILSRLPQCSSASTDLLRGLCSTVELIDDMNKDINSVRKI
ncbi:unnamed protein product [Phyllotreta striolata]|uniref:Uncharacterized protein n=1 Tax=Phyllotreta striolata TaxID=444603 RepID=A0A9N9XUQ7_PHYSR|nr:unnamed protein product [Phyllotreta striolata]